MDDSGSDASSSSASASQRLYLQSPGFGAHSEHSGTTVRDCANNTRKRALMAAVGPRLSTRIINEFRALM